MTKGKIEEWLSRIVHSKEDPADYEVVYRDYEHFVCESFINWTELKKEYDIPSHRITQIRKHGKPVYTRPGYCTKCGTLLTKSICQNKQCFAYHLEQI